MKKDISGVVSEYQEATFTIKWDGTLGRRWMNIDNLKSCLFTETHIGGKATTKVIVELAKV